jgi:hypothetical protein
LKFKLRYSPACGADDELTVNSRSMLQIMLAFSSYIDVPEEHLNGHRALSPVAQTTAEMQQNAIRIHNGKQMPTDPHMLPCTSGLSRATCEPNMLFFHAG